MKTVEFCYWLQGFFELTGEAAVLDGPRIDMVRRHLGLVRLEGSPGTFVTWLEAALDMMGDAWTPRETAKVRAKLHEVFVHEIDASYGLNKKEAAAVHSGHGYEHIQARC